jgi:MFS family permease
VRHIRLLLGINVFWLALSVFSDGFSSLLLPYYLLGVEDERYQATLLGIITFVGLLFGMLVQPIAGVLSDRLRSRWGRRGTIALGLLALLVSITLFGMSRNLWLILASYLMIQGSANIAQAGQQGFIPDLVPTRLRGTAAGIKGMMDVGGAFLGFLILGQLLSEGQSDLALLTIAVFTVFTFVMTLILVQEPVQPSLQSSSRFTLAQVFKLDLKQHPGFAWLVTSRFLFLFGTYAVGRFLLYFVADRLHLDPERAAEQAGTLFAVLTLVTALGALIAGWAADRLGRIPLMALGAALSAIGVILLITSNSAAQMLLFGAIMAFGSAAFTGANWAMTVDHVPPEEAGRFMALANFGTAGAAAAVGLLGPLIDTINQTASGSGYTVLFGISAFAFLASTWVLRKVSFGQTPIIVVGHKAK